MQKATPTPKGFRDIGPDLAKKRQAVINKIVGVLEEFEFAPIETPTIEFAETLKGKYGEEERLIYEFKDRGGRDLALRYDLTVPLARYVATYNPKLPFRRYQIGQVFRGENPQHGRYREFTQIDFDIVGSDSLEEDAKIIAAALKITDKLGIKNRMLFINDRAIFEGLEPKYVSAIDKLQKIGRDGVIKELQEKGLDKNQADELLKKIENARETTTIKEIYKHLPKFLPSGLTIEYAPFSSTLARGLNYYTGSIFELVTTGTGGLSIGGGGRYDNLIGIFAKKPIPAVGFSFGLDRLIEALP